MPHFAALHAEALCWKTQMGCCEIREIGKHCADRGPSSCPLWKLTFTISAHVPAARKFKKMGRTARNQNPGRTKNQGQDATREVNKKWYMCAYRPFVMATKGADDLRVLRLFPGAFPWPGWRCRRIFYMPSRREKSRKRILAYGRKRVSFGTH